MSDLRLAKLHATGQRLPGAGRARRRSNPSSTRSSCRRCAIGTAGIGADGLITIGPGRNGADCSMSLVNADGGRAEMSGNGVRCLAWVAARAGLLRGDELVVDTAAGRRQISDRARYVGRRDRGRRRHGRGHLRPGPDSGRRAFALRSRSARRRHDLSRRRGRRRQPALRHRGRRSRDRSRSPRTARGSSTIALFPRRMNVEFIAVTGDDRLGMRVWERGVGETQSCGTGACASAAVAHRRGLVGERRAGRRARRFAHGRARRERAARRSGRARVRRRHAARVAARVIGPSHRMTPPRAQAGRQRRRLTATEVDLERLRQRALLVGAGVGFDGRGRGSVDRRARAPRRHCRRGTGRSRCCNAGVLPTVATYVGKGKADELHELVDRSTSTS